MAWSRRTPRSVRASCPSLRRRREKSRGAALALVRRGQRRADAAPLGLAPPSRVRDRRHLEPPVQRGDAVGRGRDDAERDREAPGEARPCRAPASAREALTARSAEAPLRRLTANARLSGDDAACTDPSSLDLVLAFARRLTSSRRSGSRFSAPRRMFGLPMAAARPTGAAARTGK